MSDIVIIGLPQDAPRIRKVVEALHLAGVGLWWERPETGEKAWEHSVEVVMAARAAIFFWTAASVGESGVAYRDLAVRALNDDKAISARLERVPIPAEFHGTTMIDLAGFKAGAKDIFLLDLAAAAKAKTAGLDPPPPRGPARRLLRRAAIAFPSVMLVLGVWSTIKGVYGDLGSIPIEKSAEKHAWASVHPGSCGDLRDYLVAYPGGTHAETAKTLLSARRQWTEARAFPVTKPLPLYVSRGSAEVRASEPQARALARQRATAQAGEECESYAEAGSYRVRSASITIKNWLCEPLSGGMVCGIEGTSQCGMTEQRPVTIERCGTDPKAKSGH